MGEFCAHELAGTIASFADTLGDDFELSNFGERLAAKSAELARVTDSTVMLADDDGALACVASTSGKRCVQELFVQQHDFERQGPSVWSFRTAAFAGGALDRECERRWPTFTRRAREAGFEGAWSFPMRLRTEVIGAVNVLSVRPAIGAEESMAVQTLTDVATIGLLQRRVIERVRLVNGRLQPALDARIAVEQAKGIVAEHAHVAMDEALSLIAGYARHAERDLTAVCRDIRDGSVDPHQLLACARAHQPGRDPTTRRPV